MKAKMEALIKAAYPEAVLDHYLDTRWGQEYIFYPDEEADEPYACVVQDGRLTILTDF